MKKVKDILKGVRYQLVSGSLDDYVSNLTFDSRIVKPEDLFVAINGTLTDGHKYISTAIENGARHIIFEVQPKVLQDNITYVKVSHSAKALAVMANNYFDHPSEKLKLIGITGTNGKTTVATLLFNVFKQLGYKAGLISTININIDEERRNATHTTPDVLKINEVLAEMVDAGCSHCFMEISSHAVIQDRIWGLKFKAGIFTNITHDHLDYHQTFHNYLDAKKAFFDELDKDAFALVNADDKHHKYMIQNTGAGMKSFSLKAPGDFKGKIIESDLTGMQIGINGNEFYTDKVGEFNAYNILAAYAASCLLSIPHSDVLRILSLPINVDGRFEIIPNDNDILGIVDYAHTPDALKNVLTAIKGINKKGSKVICVFGCGGNRDKEKRPEMGKIATRMADIVIVTSDNPRFEDAGEIINDILHGIDGSEMKKVLTIPDREQAIKTACTIAKKNNIILIAGKGHETYQEIKGTKNPFDDRIIFSKYLNEIN